MSRPRAISFWSTGKDAAWAVYEAERLGLVEVVGLVTIADVLRQHVPLHDATLRELRAQAHAIGLPSFLVDSQGAAVDEASIARQLGPIVSNLRATHAVFGDVSCLESRQRNERIVDRLAIVPVFPLWGSDKGRLVNDMAVAGMRARIADVAAGDLPRTVIGTDYHVAISEFLLNGTDPIGENGEFTTRVTDFPYNLRSRSQVA